MSKTEQDIKYSVEEDIMVATAVATPNSQPPIPAGHSRFYCNKCRTVRITNCRGTCSHRSCVSAIWSSWQGHVLAMR